MAPMAGAVPARREEAPRRRARELEEATFGDSSRGRAYREGERAESPIDFNRGECHDDDHDNAADFGGDGNDIDSGDDNAGAEVVEENAANNGKGRRRFLST